MLLSQFLYLSLRNIFSALKLFLESNLLMNFFYKLYCRTYQSLLRFLIHFIKIEKPSLIEGNGSVSLIYKILNEHNIQKVFIVSGPHISKSELIKPLLESLSNHDISYYLYGKAVANTPIDVVDEGYFEYINSDSEAIIAFGGGSPIDAAKAIGAKVATNNKSVEKMRGTLKIHKRLPLLIAIPTTAGTGSEATIAAVVSNPKKHEKYALQDPCLVPRYAILDPLLIKDLPGNVTSSTGMDALTHAVEVYIGNSTTSFTRGCSILAIKLIFEYLEKSYFNPHDLAARSNMLKASYYAGLAFTRSYVGYVHAIAHTFGGFYNVGHGEANAILLPIVLKHYGSSIYKKIAHLSDELNLCDKSLSNKEKTESFIIRINKMNEAMQIKNHLKDVLKEEDIPNMIKNALREANPLYPVPKEFGYEDFEMIYKQILE